MDIPKSRALTKYHRSAYVATVNFEHSYDQVVAEALKDHHSPTDPKQSNNAVCTTSYPRKPAFGCCGGHPSWVEG